AAVRPGDRRRGGAAPGDPGADARRDRAGARGDPARLPARPRRPAARPRPVSALSPDIRSALVVGTGLIGTSAALALRAHGAQGPLTDTETQTVARGA